MTTAPFCANDDDKNDCSTERGSRKKRKQNRSFANKQILKFTKFANYISFLKTKPPFIRMPLGALFQKGLLWILGNVLYARNTGNHKKISLAQTWK